VVALFIEVQHHLSLRVNESVGLPDQPQRFHIERAGHTVIAGFIAQQDVGPLTSVALLINRVNGFVGIIAGVFEVKKQPFVSRGTY
jgi:hypothetical protein